MIIAHIKLPSYIPTATIHNNYIWFFRFIFNVIANTYQIIRITSCYKIKTNQMYIRFKLTNLKKKNLKTNKKIAELF